MKVTKFKDGTVTVSPEYSGDIHFSGVDADGQLTYSLHGSVNGKATHEEIREACRLVEPLKYMMPRTRTWKDGDDEMRDLTGEVRALTHGNTPHQEQARRNELREKIRERLRQKRR